MLNQDLEFERERAAYLEAQLTEAKQTLGKYQNAAQDLRWRLNGIYFTSVLPSFSDVYNMYLEVEQERNLLLEKGYILPGGVLPSLE
jgi:hypothetical protein